ncbi:MAG TPA: trehalase family glycosidase [Gemmatimonadaceae bacterium]|nr:trehalase family glycosidase [Gemmatimonadaceae bacterium]
MADPLTLLSRSDKTLLAAGDGNAFAPSPATLVPGFWDGASVLGRDVSPLFAVTVLDADGRELIPAVGGRQWSPAALVAEYRFARGIQATEVRTLHESGVFVSEWRFATQQPTELHVIAWTAIDAASLFPGSLAFDGALSYTRKAGEGVVDCALHALGGATSWAGLASEGAVGAPEWRVTPFLEHWHRGGLPRTMREGESARGRWFAAVHRAIAVGRNGASATFAMRCVPHESASESDTATPPAPSSSTFEGTSVRVWTRRFAELPQLRASDPFIERAYWYRWYGAWSLRIAPSTGAFASGASSAHTQSVGVADATLVPALVRDLRWHADPAWARGAIAPFIDHQRADGSFPRTVSAAGPSRATAPATIDWGGALRAYAEREPDAERVRRAWLACERYARWLFTSRESSGGDLITVRAPEDTDGAASPRFASRDGDLSRGRTISAVDASAYAYVLCDAMAELAPRVNEKGGLWTERAARVARAIRERMWDAELGFFCDLDAGTGKHIRTRTSAGFVPFAAGLGTPETTPKIVESLLDVKRFWMPFPVPSLAADEKDFDAMGEWRGTRAVFPRNGRMWPADTAMVIDALAAAEPSTNGPLRRAAAQLLNRLLRAHFHDGDLHASCACEHLNPISGHASVYRGVDEYFAAWIVDLLIRYGAGLRVDGTTLRFDPLPLGLESLSISGLRARDHVVDVTIEGERATAVVDGKSFETSIGTGIALSPGA